MNDQDHSSTPPLAPSPQWSRQRMSAAYQGLLVKRRRQAQRRAALGAVTLLLLVTALGWWVSRPTPTTPTPSPAPTLAQTPSQTQDRAPQPKPQPLSPGSLKLKDGSLALTLNTKTKLALVEESPKRLVIELAEGAARFEVSPQGDHRRFEVNAADVAVEVVGTIFEVEHRDDGVQVRVIEGKVRVRSPEGVAMLVAGERALYPHKLTLDVKDEPAASPQDVHEVRVRQGQGGKQLKAWQKLASSGSFEEAAAQIERNPWAVKNNPAELMLAADALRYTGKYKESLPYLERAERASDKAQAGRAAFTRGLLLLKNLKRYDEAAAAFAKARALAPEAALAQDALAREVEARSRQGQKALAKERANEYLRLYPDGHRQEAVRHFGQLPASSSKD